MELMTTSAIMPVITIFLPLSTLSVSPPPIIHVLIIPHMSARKVSAKTKIMSVLTILRTIPTRPLKSFGAPAANVRSGASISIDVM